MTRDEINRLIQDNELFHGTMKLGVIMDMNHLERLVDLVAAAEREVCARVLDEMADDMAREMEPSTAIAYVRSKAAAIRARGEK